MRMLLLAAALLLTNGLFAQYDTTSYWKAQSAWQQKEYRQVVKHLNQAFANGKALPRYYLLRGQAQVYLGNYQQAIADLNRTESALAVTATEYKARAYALSGQTEKAIEQLARHRKLSSRRSYHALYADTSFQSIAHTRAWADFWAGQQDYAYENWLDEARIQLMDGHTEYAAELAEKALKHTSSPKAHALLGQVYFHNGDYALAIDEWEQASYLYKSQPELLLWQAQAYQQSGRQRKALQLMDEALTIDPFRLDFRLEKGRLLMAQEKAHEAGEWLYPLFQALPTDEQVALTYAQTQYQAGYYVEALKAYNQLLEHHPPQALYLAARGNAKRQLDWPQKAIYDYSMALDLQADMKEVYFHRAQLRFETGDTEGACTDWRKAAMYGYEQAIPYYQRLCTKGP